MNRYLESPLLESLSEKMVFIGGPRQVGKTTMAKQIGAQLSPMHYYNWDTIKNKKVTRVWKRIIL